MPQGEVINFFYRMKELSEKTFLSKFHKFINNVSHNKLWYKIISSLHLFNDDSKKCLQSKETLVMQL